MIDYQTLWVDACVAQRGPDYGVVTRRLVAMVTMRIHESLFFPLLPAVPGLSAVAVCTCLVELKWILNLLIAAVFPA